MSPKNKILIPVQKTKCNAVTFHIFNFHLPNSDTFIQALLAMAVFPQRFTFFTVCLVYCLREMPPWRVWNWCLQITGKSISNLLSNYRNIACTSLLNMVFFLWILWFGDKFTQNWSHWPLWHRISEEWNLLVHCQWIWSEQL